MGRQSGSNLPTEPLRWGVEKAGIEFAVSRNTLGKALNQVSAVPDEDGLFSTPQLVRALYGELYLEKVRTQREISRKLELENAITTAAFLSRADLENVFSQLADALVGVVKNSNLDRRSQEDFLHNLATGPILVQGVAHNQSRLPRGNGTRPESEGEER
jgi:hypothetical protein